MLDGFLERLDRVATPEALTDELVALRDVFAVDHLAYTSLASHKGPWGALTYDPQWVARYVERGYARIDPVVQGCYRRFGPIDWRHLDWSGKAQRRFQDEAIEAGVGNQGLSIPVRGPAGQFAIFSASHTTTDAAWSNFVSGRLREMILAAHYTNEKALALRPDGAETRAPTPLSPRETDALNLLARGLSRAQAADSLAISQHTLRVYIESARFKLAAMNTTHAVAKAMSHGLLVG